MLNKQQLELSRAVEKIVLYLLKNQFMERSSSVPLVYNKQNVWVEINPYAVTVYNKPKTWFNTTMIKTLDYESVIQTISEMI